MEIVLKNTKSKYLEVFSLLNLDNINIPIIVRLQGTNSAKAKEIIDSSGLNVQSATAFDEAATKVQAAIN